ncbi:MAG: radical SAM protein [candidate division NC10 bacterium]|nr:radical SAM protein [candidate division NC10 bacterium]
MSDNGTKAGSSSRTNGAATGLFNGRLKVVKQSLLEGGPGFCQFAINNACNAACDFCSFSLDALPREDWVFAPLPKAKDAIDILVRHGVRYLVITGGEPMLHPDCFDIIRHAKGQGMVVILVTNGSRLDGPNIQALKESGLSSIIISIDATSAKVHEDNRRLPKVCEKIKKANELLRQVKIQSTASVTMSRLIGDYAQLPGFLKSLGFESVTFSYPLTTLGSSFLGHANSHLVSYTPDELLRAFDEVKKLKPYLHVVNPTASLEEMQRFLRKEPQRFECLGGYKYFYLDWDFLIWRCHYWEEPICSIFEFDDSRRIRDGCTRCMIDCYRDASVMQHVAVSVSDSIAQARQGLWRGAAKSLFTRSNLDSLKSVFEGLNWITRI